jgi:thiamine biosynthesis lipoprotein
MKRIQKTIFALGTANYVIIYCKDDEQLKVTAALERISIKVQYLDDLLSVFKESSEISRINAAAGESLVDVSQDTWNIISRALEFSENSEGAFDITVRPLSKLWGIGRHGDFVPEEDGILEAVSLVNYKDILIDEKAMSIGLRKKGQAIDLGSIAKGYAADEARSILLENDITDAVINFGGTVIVLGEEKKVGIQNPEKARGISMGLIEVKNQAVVTSGRYERYFIKEGKVYHHIMDPRTGMPTDNGITSFTAVGGSAIELDALTTAVFILGLEKGTKLLERYNTEGVFITDKHDVYITKGMEGKFSIQKQGEAI